MYDNRYYANPKEYIDDVLIEWAAVNGPRENPFDYTLPEIERKIEDYHSGNLKDFEEE